MQGGRQLGGPGVGGRQQLLGEERVALGTGENALDQRHRRHRAQDRRHLRGRLGPAQPAQLQALAAGAAELGQEGAEPRALRLVAAVSDHQHDPLAAQVAGQEGQQVPGRPVGPVHVLDHQDQGGLVGEGTEQADEELEQPGLVGWLRRRHRAGMTRSPRAGRRRASSGQDGPASARTGSTPTWPTRSRSASTAGAKGSSPSANGTQPPTSTRVPILACRAANSLARRVLPTPASPPMRTTTDAPPSARPRAASSAASSCARPTRGGLVTWPPISPGLSPASGQRETGDRRSQRPKIGNRPAPYVWHLPDSPGTSPAHPEPTSSNQRG